MKSNTDNLPIVEMFSSIQGEGLNTGKAAFFIRLGGCDVCCTWCDEKIAWDESQYPQISIDSIIDQVRKSHAKTVVVTGGEPFRHNLSSLTNLLQKQNILCMAETSGTELISGEWNWITLSPKKHHPPIDANYRMADELKVVIQKDEDFIWAVENASYVKPETELYLQPEWNNRYEILPRIIRYIIENPQWRLSVQMHKFLNIP